MPKCWLNTYHPLEETRASGPWTRRDPPPPRFADASCRREPDLESAFPTITALCRGKKAVTRFDVDDVVVYTTIKGPYDGLAPHRRLTAILRVIWAAKSHAEAADFYRRDKRMPLPRNLLLPDNPPLPLDLTEGFYRRGSEREYPADESDWPRVVREWDATYYERKNRCQEVRICEPLFVDIHDGRVIDAGTESAVFGSGGFPNTEWRPARIEREVAVSLSRACGLDDVTPRLVG